MIISIKGNVTMTSLDTHTPRKTSKGEFGQSANRLEAKMVLSRDNKEKLKTLSLSTLIVGTTAYAGAEAIAFASAASDKAADICSHSGIASRLDVCNTVSSTFNTLSHVKTALFLLACSATSICLSSKAMARAKRSLTHVSQATVAGAITGGLLGGYVVPEAAPLIANMF